MSKPKSKQRSAWPVALGASAVTLGVLDAAWIGLAARKLYDSEMPHLMASDLQPAPAAAFYAVYVGATTALAVQPGDEDRTTAQRVRDGAILGAAAYSAWGFTGAAVLDRFPIKVALADVAWGTFVTAATAGVAGLVLNRLKRRRLAA